MHKTITRLFFPWSMRYVSACVFILVFLIGFSSPQAQGQKDKIPVLIVDGFSNHDWKQTTNVTKWILEQSGRFKIDISTISSDSIERAAWLPQFSKYAVVIQNTNN